MKKLLILTNDNLLKSTALPAVGWRRLVELQGDPGAIAVLHTHSRELNYHPHIHVVMPAAIIDKTNKLFGSRYFCESLFWASQPKQAAKT